MQLPDWIRSAAERAAKGLKLVPTDIDRLKSQMAQYEQNLQDACDRQAALELEIRKIENQLLKLDEKRQKEHGAIARAALREMQVVGAQHQTKENQLHEAIDLRADLNLMISRIDLLLAGKPIKADQWDDIGFQLETLHDEDSEAKKARKEVEDAPSSQLRNLDGEVNVDSILGEIRGETSPQDPRTDSLLRKIKRRDDLEAER